MRYIVTIPGRLHFDRPLLCSMSSYLVSSYFQSSGCSALSFSSSNGILINTCRFDSSANLYALTTASVKSSLNVAYTSYYLDNACTIPSSAPQPWNTTFSTATTPTCYYKKSLNSFVTYSYASLSSLTYTVNGSVTT